MKKKVKIINIKNIFIVILLIILVFLLIKFFTVKKGKNDTSKTENIELDENSQATLSENPTNLFLYNVNGEKIDDFTISEKTLTVTADPYSEFTADYQYKYQSDSTIYTLGRNLINGFVELEARTRVKDDETGHVVTGIIKIPKLKLLSNFSIRLGRQTDPMIGRFNAIGVPVGSRDNSYVCEFFVLNDDIDSDI